MRQAQIECDNPACSTRLGWDKAMLPDGWLSLVVTAQIGRRQPWSEFEVCSVECGQAVLASFPAAAQDHLFGSRVDSGAASARMRDNAPA